MRRVIHTLIGVYLTIFTPIINGQSHSDSNASTGTHRTVNAGQSGNDSCLGRLTNSDLALLENMRNIMKHQPPDEQMINQIYEKLRQQDIPENRRHALAGLIFGELNSAARRNDLLNPTGPYASDVDKLKQFGATVGPNGINLSGLDLKAINSYKNSLEKVFPEANGLVHKLNDPENHQPIFLGDQIIMPPSYGASGRNRVISRDQYSTELANVQQRFEGSFKNYLESSNEAASGWEVGKEALIGKESPQKAMAEGYYKQMLNRIAELRDNFGYPPEKTIALRDRIRQALNDNTNKTWDGVSQFQMAALATAAAPLAWPALAIGGTSAAIGMGVGLGLTGLDIAVSAKIASAYSGGSFVCELGKKAFEKGPTGFLLSLAGSGIGKVVAGASNLTQTGLKMLLTGKDGVLDAAKFAAAYKALSLTATGTILAPGVYYSGRSFFEAHELSKLAEVAKADGNIALANAYEELAAQAKAAGATGLAAAVVLPVAAKYMGKAGAPNSSPSILQSAEKLKLPAETVKQIIQRASAGAIPELEEAFAALAAKNGKLTSDELLKFSALLKKHGVQDLFRFHTTQEGTIDKILSSGGSSQSNKPHLRPGSKEWAIYALDEPANKSALGVIRAVSQKATGPETVVFQGDAAKLFKPHPMNGSGLGYKVVNGEKVVGYKQLVIDEYVRLDGQTLVVTKAHLESLTAQQAASARWGRLMFHAPEMVLGGAAAAKGVELLYRAPDEDNGK